MSASRQKKLRQELAAQGVVDPKLVREAEAKAEERKANRLYITIAAIFVVLTVVLLVNKSGIIQRSATAMTVNGDKFSVGEVQMQYNATLNNIRNSAYADYFGLDETSSLKNQNLGDMAKIFLGVEEDMSWHDYLTSTAKKDLAQINLLYKKAVSEGYTADEEIKKTVDANITSLETYASASGYNAAAYLKILYGNNVTVDIFKSMIEKQLVVQKYVNDYVAGLEFSDDEMRAFVEENPDEFYMTNYEYIFFKATADSTTDASGNTVEPTEEQKKAAEDAAKAAAEDAKKRFKAGESLKDIADSIEIATYAEVKEGAHTGSTVDEWAREAGRKAGDAEILNTASTYYFAVFHSCDLADYNTVDVRHILIAPDTDELDTAAATYEADLAAAKAAAKAKAEEIYAQWKSNATEENFAQLANENSDDGAVGGLYEKVFHNQMVSEFNDWIFDSARKTGDSDIVETQYGYHIMYFVGQNELYWKMEAQEHLASESYSQMVEELTSSATIVDGSGMKYVG